jgi:hypothetical protein
MDTGPAKPPRLKVRLVQVWNVGIKNELVGTHHTSPFVGCNKLKQTIRVANQASKKLRDRRAQVWK